VARYTSPQPYEELDHTGDAAIRVRGADPEQALARLVLAFGQLVAGDAPVHPCEQWTVAVGGDDRILMAVDVLRELLYEFECTKRIPTACHVVEFDPQGGCEVQVELGPFDPELHAEGLDIKAVTFHEGRFEREAEDWIAEVVFDI
jgi:SHS2 domain-containing protein